VRADSFLAKADSKRESERIGFDSAINRVSIGSNRVLEQIGFESAFDSAFNRVSIGSNRLYSSFF
jgi:hypothetical protein